MHGSQVPPRRRVPARVDQWPGSCVRVTLPGGSAVSRDLADAGPGELASALGTSVTRITNAGGTRAEPRQQAVRVSRSKLVVSG